jgi:hypothetical protein
LQVLKDIVKWRAKATAPKVKMTATQRRRLAKIERDRENMDSLVGDPTAEPTSMYGTTKVPCAVQIIALNFAVEEVRRIHHLHHQNQQDNFSDNSSEMSQEDDDDGYKSNVNQERQQSVMFNVDDLRSVLRRGTVALNNYTSNQLQKQFREQQVNKFPIFKMAGNMTMERMQCVMVVAGATAASCSLLSKMNTPLTKDLTLRCRKKMKEILLLSKKKNFFQQLLHFRPAQVKKWANAPQVISLMYSSK